MGISTKLHYLEHCVCIHSAHGGHHYHCLCPVKLGPPHQPRAPFQQGLGPPVPVWTSQGVPFPTWATALPLPGQWLTPPQEAPTRSELEPPRQHVIPHAGRSLPTNPLLPQHWSLGWKPESCIATATMFQLTCKKKLKDFPPALPAITTGLISASCSQA